MPDELVAGPAEQVAGATVDVADDERRRVEDHDRLGHGVEDGESEVPVRALVGGLTPTVPAHRAVGPDGRVPVAHGIRKDLDTSQVAATTGRRPLRTVQQARAYGGCTCSRAGIAGTSQRGGSTTAGNLTPESAFATDWRLADGRRGALRGAGAKPRAIAVAALL